MASPASTIIITEGKADDEFIEQLIKVSGIDPEAFEVRRALESESYGYSGFERRLAALKTETGLDNRRAIILVADNDDLNDKFFLKIRDQISSAGGYGVPSAPLELVSGDERIPPIAVLMLPWADEPGCLDSLCLQAACNQRPHYVACIEQFVTCVKALDWPISSLHKLKLRCLLSSACKQDPNTPLVHVWKSNRRDENLVPLNDPCFGRIVEFLRSFLS
ncbi:MAG TPA: DUF3226 domain-containing protein [Chthoniobacteraceae bacterium]|nr:DUF3226 domain-containing protein [Chthoniobacteraceae bacterium]